MALHRGGGRHPAGTGRGSKRRTLGPHGVAPRESAKARKRRTHLIIRLGGILSNEGVLGYDEGVWNDEGNRQRLLDMQGPCRRTARMGL